ncbi:hypothetical protein UM677_001786 [Cronobacter sakazakii]|nr:hypothetical protein [Cronobacter sakazakii]
MTVFLILTTIAYGIGKAGSFILLVVNGYLGWIWFFRNYDRLPRLYRLHWRYQRRFILSRILKRLSNRFNR